MRTLARIELKGAFTQLAPSFVFNAFIGKNAELFGVGDGGCLMPSGAEGGKRVSVAARQSIVMEIPFTNFSATPTPEGRRTSLDRGGSFDCREQDLHSRV